MQTHQDRIIAVQRTLGRCLEHYGFNVLLTGDAQLIATGEQIITAIESAVAEFEDLSLPKRGVYLTRAQRIVSLVNALESVARNRGPSLLPTDTLHQLVVASLTGVERAFWASEQPQTIAGFINYKPLLVEALKERGILVWRFDNGGQTRDEQTRLVDTQWRQSHADIYAHIFGAPEPGQRCRFCRLHESESHNLVDFPLHIDARVSTTARVHAACYQVLGNWVAIARKYPGIEAAQAADIEAGRTHSDAPSIPKQIAAPEPGPILKRKG